MQQREIARVLPPTAERDKESLFEGDSKKTRKNDKDKRSSSTRPNTRYRFFIVQGST